MLMGMGLIGVAGFGVVMWTPWMYRAYEGLSRDGSGAEAGEGWIPTDIVVFGGSGVPGESALMRLWYAAAAAGEYPEAAVWVAMPGEEKASGSSRAYLAELELRGVEKGRGRVIGGGVNTRGQALEVVRRVGEGARVLVVTSPEHVRRACGALRRAAREGGRPGVEVRGRGAFSVSLDEDLVWRAEELAAGGAEGEILAVATPDAGGWMGVRYELWGNLQYGLDAMREWVAWGYYAAKGWI